MDVKNSSVIYYSKEMNVVICREITTFSKEWGEAWSTGLHKSLPGNWSGIDKSHNHHVTFYYHCYHGRNQHEEHGN